MRLKIPNSLLSTNPDGEIWNCNEDDNFTNIPFFSHNNLLPNALSGFTFLFTKKSTLKPNLNYRETSSNVVQ